MIEPKAKAFYLELADLMDKHGIDSIQAACEGTAQSEPTTSEFAYWQYDVVLEPKSIRAFVERAVYASGSEVKI